MIPARATRCHLEGMDGLTQTVVALTALVTALSGLVPAFVYLRRRYSAAARRIDNVWRGRWIRGTQEGICKGLLVPVPGPEPDYDTDPDAGVFIPVTVTPEVAEAFAPIGPELRAMRGRYAEEGVLRFAELVEVRFAPWIAENVCARFRVFDYACIVMAVTVAAGIPPAAARPAP
jgi:hypothetical protein